MPKSTFWLRALVASLAKRANGLSDQVNALVETLNEVDPALRAKYERHLATQKQNRLEQKATEPDMSSPLENQPLEAIRKKFDEESDEA